MNEWPDCISARCSVTCFPLLHLLSSFVPPSSSFLLPPSSFLLTPLFTHALTSMNLLSFPLFVLSFLNYYPSPPCLPYLFFPLTFLSLLPSSTSLNSKHFLIPLPSFCIYRQCLSRSVSLSLLLRPPLSPISLFISLSKR